MGFRSVDQACKDTHRIEGAVLRLKRRELIENDECKKCGSFPQPKLVPSMDGEYLSYHCDCGYKWTSPTRDTPGQTPDVFGAILVRLALASKTFGLPPSKMLNEEDAILAQAIDDAVRKVDVS